MFSRAAALRVGAHVVAWLPFAVAAARESFGGWRAISDNAVIALRAWDVLSAHAPMVGQATRLTHSVYDPGPLQYWLLAGPVHVDPLHGVLWGAALWCVLAASLTIEAAWSAAGRLGGLLAAGVILGLIAWNPQIATLPCWNPWFGMMYFLAALAACWAAMTGHRWWWPVAVITASIAAQAHLMFTVTAAAVALLALAVGLVDTRRARARYWWAIVGLVAGLACWSAPLYQQFTSSNGNLAAILAGKATPGGLAGLHFGLKALAAAAQPPPFWWTPIRSLGKLSLIDQRSATVGVVVLALAVVLLAVALFVLRSRRIATLAAVSLVVTVTMMFVYAHIPRSSIDLTTTNVSDLRYLMAPLFAVGVLAWLSLAATGVQVVRQATRAPRPSTAANDRPLAGAHASTAARRAVPALWLAALAFAGLAALVGVEISAPVTQNATMRIVGNALTKIERSIPGRPIRLTVRADNRLVRRQVTMGLAYALNTAGYLPEIRPQWGSELGSRYIFIYNGQQITHVAVQLMGAGSNRLAVQVTWPMPNGSLERSGQHRNSGRQRNKHGGPL